MISNNFRTKDGKIQKIISNVIYDMMEEQERRLTVTMMVGLWKKVSE